MGLNRLAGRGLPARVALLVVALLAVALAVDPVDGAASVDRARYTLDVRLTAIRDYLGTRDGTTVGDTHRTTVWRARSRKPFVLQRRGTRRRPSYRFRTVVRGAARNHRVRGWETFETTTVGPCRIFPNDLGPLPGSRLKLTVRSASRGPTSHRRLAIAVARANAMVTTLYPAAPCPAKFPGVPEWFPGSSLPCDWCAVRPVTLVYPFERPDLIRDVRFRRRFVLRRTADPVGYPRLHDERTQPGGSLTVTDTSLQWTLTFRPVRRR